MKTPTSEVAAALLDQHPSERAYAQLLPELLAVADEDLQRINLDIIFLVNNMLGAMPEINDMREDVQRTFQDFDMSLFDRFKICVLALNHANSLYRASRAMQRSATEQARIVEERRDRLLSLALTMSKFGLLDGEPLSDIKKEPGYRSLASDTLTLVTLLKQNWDNIAGSCPISERDLNLAGMEVLDLQTALGLQQQAPALRHEAAENRRKAYTLFRQAYEPIRRAALFLYGEDRANEIVPKLTPGNTRSTPQQTSALEQEFDPEDGTTPPPNDSAAANVNDGNRTAPTTQTTVSAEQLAASNPRGFPVGSVFTAQDE